MKTLRIEWSYPSSPNAAKFGFSKTGCWTVEFGNAAIAAFKELKDAQAFLAKNPTVKS